MALGPESKEIYYAGPNGAAEHRQRVQRAERTGCIASQRVGRTGGTNE